MLTTSAILLTLFILNLGTAFGAGLYETVIILPKWFPRSPDAGYTVDTTAMRDIDSGRKFWGMVTTMPLTLLTFANLYFAAQSPHPAHDWWVAAALITLVERISTFSFFIPTAIKLQNAETLTPARIHGMVSRWVKLNSIRCTLNLLGWILAIEALALYF
jgi:hypothetical protein